MNPPTPRELSSIYCPLRTTLGLVALVAGIDKFFNLLVDWAGYLPSAVVERLPMSPGAFMRIVGVIEIIAGLAVLWLLPRIGAHVVMVWLIMISGVLIVGGYYDIAVRDLAMAVAAFALGQASRLRGDPWLPVARSGGRPA